jgi:hypothetical protein
VVGATEATVVDVGVVVVEELPVSLVLTLQLLVEAAGDFDAFPGSLPGDFFSKTLLFWTHGRIYHIELLRRAREALWVIELTFPLFPA